MAITYVPVGVEQKFFAKAEATFDTVSAFASADAVPLVSLDIKPALAFIESKERVGTASLQTEVSGEAGGTWSASFYMKPNGTTVNTEPDAGVFIKAAMGAVDTSSTAQYEFKTSSGEVSTVSTLQIAKHVGKGRYEIINGAWIEQIDFEFNGNAENVINVSGGFATFGFCYGATVNGAHSTSDTTIVCQPRDGLRIGVNSYVQFDDAGSVNDNSSAGYLVTAVDTATETITISPGITGSIADNTAVQPFTPAQTLTTNNPIFGTLNWAQIGSFAASIAFISAKCSVATGFHGLSGEGQYGKAKRVVRGNRSVTGELSVYFLSSDQNNLDHTRFIGGAHSGQTHSLIIGAGAVTKEALMLTLPKVRFNVASVSDSETDESTVSMSFVARQNSAAGDELVVGFW